MYVFYKLLENAIAPLKATEGSAGYDLHSYEDITICPRSVVCVSTGLRMEIEPGYFGKIFPRSGLVINHTITTDAGIIDSDYRGVVHVCLKNVFDKHFHIKKGDGIAQIVFLKHENANFVQVDKLSDTERGYKGFGSTGK